MRKKKPKRKAPQKVDPLYVDGKLVCPICKERKYVKVTNYGSSKTKGFINFEYTCEECNVKFERDVAIAEL